MNGCPLHSAGILLHPFSHSARAILWRSGPQAAGLPAAAAVCQRLVALADALRQVPDPLRLIPLALRQPWHVMQTNAQCHAYRVTSWVRQMSRVLHEEIPAKGEGIRGLQSMLTAVAAGVLRQKSHARCEEHSADAVRTYRSNSAGSHAMKACAPAAPACPHQRPACPAPSSAPAWRHSPAPGTPPGCAAGSRMLPGGDCRVPAAASPCYCCCSGLEGLYSDAGF